MLKSAGHAEKRSSGGLNAAARPGVLPSRPLEVAPMKLPDGWHTLTPRIVTNDVPGLVDFVRRVFGANGDVQEERPTVLRIGDSVLMISDVGPRPATPAFLYVYVDDAEATYKRAVDAGAKSLDAPLDTPYGDRRAMVEDRWGNVWQIATFRG
jgi:PhnB protein